MTAHDRAYHDAGGATRAEQSYAARRAADAALRACVAATAEDRRAALAAQYGMRADQVGWAYQAIAQGMYLAVRFGGGPCSGLPWRWGYGYAQCFPLGAAADAPAAGAGE